MKKGSYPGEFEELVLLLVAIMGNDLTAWQSRNHSRNRPAEQQRSELCMLLSIVRKKKALLIRNWLMPQEKEVDEESVYSQ